MDQMLLSFIVKLATSCEESEMLIFLKMVMTYRFLNFASRVSGSTVITFDAVNFSAKYDKLKARYDFFMFS